MWQRWRIDCCSPVPVVDQKLISVILLFSGSPFSFRLWGRPGEGCIIHQGPHTISDTHHKHTQNSNTHKHMYCRQTITSKCEFFLIQTNRARCFYIFGSILLPLRTQTIKQMISQLSNLHFHNKSHISLISAAVRPSLNPEAKPYITNFCPQTKFIRS